MRLVRPWALRPVALALLAMAVATPSVHAALVSSYEAQPGSSGGSRRASSARGASHARTAPAARTAPRAPSGPPLSVGLAAGGDPSASAPPGGEDTLVGNGLGSPLCDVPSELPASAKQSCETADFIGAPDPTGDYALDVNINTGVGELGNYVSTTVQDMVAMGWLAFVSVTHGLVVMLEWCYSLQLLSGPLLARATRTLHDLRSAFTEPLLALALSVASVLAIYHGLLRRRITETLGQTLATLAMMAGGLWIVADPAGTVGAFERAADQAGLGTLATMLSGTPDHPQVDLADGMQALFGGVVGAPWCYLEFGEVGWCRESGSVDGRLRTAALAIAGREQSQSGCHSLCGADAGAKDRTLAASAALLRSAQTNGELFLALPANELQRNSVSTKGTLLNVLCGRGESADKCTGPTAAQAEFRSEKGTQPRVIGACMIAVGGLGMLLLYGFIALRLLTAALATLLYLMLAPALVLAPALGERGRAAFRSWATHLLGAVVSKLVYSFVLGTALLMTKALLSLTMLGWLAQWLLISAFWWETFLKRHQLLAMIDGGASRSTRDSLARRVRDTIEAPRLVLAARRYQQTKRTPGPEVEPRRLPERSELPPMEEPLGRREPPDGTPRPAPGEDRTAPQPGAPQSGPEARWEENRSPSSSASVRVAEAQPKSTVMDDAKEVLSGRKSKLGLDPRQ